MDKIGRGAAIALASCTAARLDPAVVSVGTFYYPQSLDVITQESFVASCSNFRGGTPQELAAEFATSVKTGVTNDLPKVMTGQAPASVTIELTSLELGPDIFTARSIAANGVVTIVDIKTGATVLNIPIHVDNSDFKNSKNKDPMAAAIGGVILKGVVSFKNIDLWNLASVFRWEVKSRLRGKQVPS